MTSNTTIEKMESTPFSRQTSSIISLSFDNKTTCKPHIFACYNNEVSSSIYLHNKLIVLNTSKNCNDKDVSSNEELEQMIDRFINDIEVRFDEYLLKDTFYLYASGSQSNFIRYIENSDILYTDKTFASAKGFVMYSNGEYGTSGGGADSGTLYHDLLENRNLTNQHTIGAITDLQAMLDSKVYNSDPRLNNARPADGGVSDSAKYIRALAPYDNTCMSYTFDNISMWKLSVDHSLYKRVSVAKSDFSENLSCPNNGLGSLKIGTNIENSGYLDARAPVVRTTDYLYFTTDTMYHLAIGYWAGKTEFSSGLSDGFRFKSTIQCTGSIVMYSTI